MTWEIIYVILVYLVIVTIIYTVNSYITFNTKLPLPLRLVALLFFNTFASLTVITHIKSMLTPPGYVPNPYAQKVRVSYCDKCKNNRPLMSHHCKKCKKCVLKMDHHCVWINNCVGYFNQKNFYQFLTCAVIGNFIATLLMIVGSLYVDFSINGHVPKGSKVKSVFELINYMAEPIGIVIGGLCALAMTVGIGAVFIKQTFMILRNQTTIEKKMCPKWEDSMFYCEDKVRCWKDVMGSNWKEWFSMQFKGNHPFDPIIREVKGKKGSLKKKGGYAELDETI